MEDAVSAWRPDCILHLGDYSSDSLHLRELFPTIQVYGVRGNCDMTSGEPLTEEFILGGKRFFMTHGHLFKVKQGYESIVKAGLSRRADILLFGHTHVPYCHETDGMQIVNPGSASYSRGTCAVLELIGGECRVRLISIDECPEELN